MPWWRASLETLAPVAAAIVGSFMAFPLLLFWRPADQRWLTVAATTAGGFAAMLTCMGLLRLEGRRLSSVGWTTQSLGLNIVIGFGAYFFSFVALMVLSLTAYVVFPEIREHEEVAAKAIEATFPPMRTATMIAFMLFVAGWEEIAFRGFMLTRLQSVLRKWWLTIPAGAVLFGIGHFYEGPLAVVVIMGLGIALGLLFWWRKSLVPCIIFHAMNNIVALLLLNAV